jgi:hypothetical protein
MGTGDLNPYAMGLLVKEYTAATYGQLDRIQAMTHNW